MSPRLGGGDRGIDNICDEDDIGDGDIDKVGDEDDAHLILNLAEWSAASLVPPPRHQILMPE